MTPIVIDAIGKKFNKLTVLRFVEFRRANKHKQKVPMVECLCECGKTKIVSLWDIRAGKSKTCGFKHPHYEDRSVPAFNFIYNYSYKARAEKRGWKFDLTEEQFRSLCEQDCHYCGTSPTAVTYRGKRGLVVTGSSNSEWAYNGLDRVDSTEGYTLANVVPCCGICNHAKHTMQYADFIGWLDSITKFAVTRAKQTLVLIEEQKRSAA